MALLLDPDRYVDSFFRKKLDDSENNFVSEEQVHNVRCSCPEVVLPIGGHHAERRRLLSTVAA